MKLNIYSLTHQILREECDSDAADQFAAKFTHAPTSGQGEQLLTMLNFWNLTLRQLPRPTALSWNTVAEYEGVLRGTLIPLLEMNEISIRRSGYENC